MKKDTLLGFLVVIAAILAVLAVFCWVDGIPAANLLTVLVAVMR